MGSQGKRIKIGYEKRLAPSFLRGHSDAGGSGQEKVSHPAALPGRFFTTFRMTARVRSLRAVFYHDFDAFALRQDPTAIPKDLESV